MIIFDLQCKEGGHVFEAWFGSSSDFEDQKKRNLLLCPICGDQRVSKAIMAPNVAAKGNQAASEPATTQLTAPDPASAPVAEMKEMLAKVAELQAKALKDSKWVGKDFEKQARAMEAGDTARAPIHGQATAEQTKAMLEDGIGIMPLLVPVVPPEERN